MRQTDKMAGCSVTSQVNAVLQFFHKDEYVIRPVRPIDNLGIVPTTEHNMLGDWSTSSPNRQLGDCTDHRA